MFVHIVLFCLYKSLVNKNHIPILLLLPKLFFPPLHAAEEFGREALGKPGEELLDR